MTPVSEQTNAPAARESLSKRLRQSPLVLSVAARALSTTLRLVNATNPMTFEPWTNVEVFKRHAPFIAAVWHGQAFLLPLTRPKGWAADVLVSKSADAELIARVISNLDLGLVRGSGAADPSRMFEKGAVSAFRGMKAALDAGRTVGVTADFLKEARRKVSPGIVALARLTRRPIVPLALASSRYITMGTWDSTTIPLPFGRAACVFGRVVEVPRDASPELQEQIRQQVEDDMHAADLRAYEIVGRRRG